MRQPNHSSNSVHHYPTAMVSVDDPLYLFNPTSRNQAALPVLNYTHMHTRTHSRTHTHTEHSLMHVCIHKNYTSTTHTLTHMRPQGFRMVDKELRNDLVVVCSLIIGSDHIESAPPASSPPSCFQGTLTPGAHMLAH